jgi:hypothetical protein
MYRALPSNGTVDILTQSSNIVLISIVASILRIFAKVLCKYLLNPSFPLLEPGFRPAQILRLKNCLACTKRVVYYLIKNSDIVFPFETNWKRVDLVSGNIAK